MARPVVYGTVSVEGFKELEKELERLGGIAAKKAVARSALRKAMQPVHKMAVQLAPDDPRTGPPYDLKKSIKNRFQRENRARIQKNAANARRC